MQDIVNPIQSTSYTNKDFEDIYTELIGLADELSYKWKPSSSNESDPGIVLLKLNALIADKCNYNIDKNVLECFPMSVTQEVNARNLFEQLGYYMDWYESAVMDVTLKWTGTVGTATYTIPTFTPVCDSDSGYMYTLIGLSDGTTSSDFSTIGDMKLSTTGSILTAKAIQGTPLRFTYSDDTTIRYDVLDSDNRLYFNATAVAQNGIFITNLGMNNYSEWKRVDNLYVEGLGQRIYKFGVTNNGTVCYIEFPSDASSLFGEGIEITYILTEGYEGNCGISTVSQLYEEMTAYEDESVTLNSENLLITNYVSANNGKDPESINDAYANYKTTVGTFNTLISLNDYHNYLINEGLCSNNFIGDRRNDIQSTYKIMTYKDGINTTSNVLCKDSDGNPELTAFSLKLYVLEADTDDTITSAVEYNNTYNLIDGSLSSKILSYIEDSKSIQHDFVNIKPRDTSKSRFCFFENRFPITCTIIPQYELTSTQQTEVIQNIKLALYDAFNSSEISFGESITYDLVNSVISNSDERIKTALLDSISYHTYAIYHTGDLESGMYTAVNISDEQDDIYDITYDESLISVDVDSDVFNSKIDEFDYSTYVFEYNDSDKKWTLDDSEVSISDYGLTFEIIDEELDTAEISISRATQMQFRDEIFVKSVLAGKTQLLIEDDEFFYAINQNMINKVDNVERISSEVKITFEQDETTGTDSTTYTLRDNENIQLFAPNLIQSKEYSSYVKFEYFIEDDVEANENYQLKTDEYIAFYWKDSEDEDVVYSYYIYGEGNIINPSFDLEAVSDDSTLIAYNLKSGFRNIGTISHPIFVADSEFNGSMDWEYSESISEYTDSDHTLSTNRFVLIKEFNQVELSTEYCYWILNEDSDGKYTLFSDGESSRVLDTGEYFIYSDSTLSNLEILGSGTEISRETSSGAMQVEVMPTTDITNVGIDTLIGYWYQLSSNITVTENQLMTIGPGCEFMITPVTFSASCTITPTITGTGDLSVSSIDNELWVTSYAGEVEGVFTFKYIADETDNENYWVYLGTHESQEAEDPYVYLEDFGVECTGTPNVGDVIKFDVVSPKWKKVLSNTAISLKDFSLQYRTSSTSKWEEIEEIDLVYHTGWKARSLLNLLISPTNEQVLLSNQTMKYYIEGVTYNSDEDVPTLVGADATDTSQPLCIRGSISLELSGGDFISTYEYTDEGYKYLSMYIYEKNISSDGILYTDDGSMYVECSDSNSYRSINFSLPVGEYIIPFENTLGYDVRISLDETTLGDITTGTTLHEIYSEDISNFNNKSKRHYAYLNILEEKSHTLTVYVGDGSSDASVTLYHIYKYTHSDIISKDYFEKLLRLIKIWDTENIFDYTYSISSASNIEDPLDSKSFMNTSHIFNEYTICKVDTSTSSTFTMSEAS